MTYSARTRRRRESCLNQSASIIDTMATKNDAPNVHDVIYIPPGRCFLRHRTRTTVLYLSQPLSDYPPVNRDPPGTNPHPSCAGGLRDSESPHRSTLNHHTQMIDSKPPYAHSHRGDRSTLQKICAFCIRKEHATHTYQSIKVMPHDAEPKRQRTRGGCREMEPRVSSRAHAAKKILQLTSPTRL